MQLYLQAIQKMPSLKVRFSCIPYLQPFLHFTSFHQFSECAPNTTGFTTNISTMMAFIFGYCVNLCHDVGSCFSGNMESPIPSWATRNIATNRQFHEIMAWIDRIPLLNFWGEVVWHCFPQPVLKESGPLWSWNFGNIQSKKGHTLCVSQSH